MMESLRDLVESEKTILEPSAWTLTGRCFELKLPLSIEGLAEEQFFFRATALASVPDQQVVFQLEYHGIRILGGTGPLCRFEWNPKGVHNNKGRGPVELQFVDQEGSHFHSFDDNWHDASGALMRDNLPIARPINESIQDFIECLLCVGKLLNIKNIGIVETPEWMLQLSLDK